MRLEVLFGDGRGGSSMGRSGLINALQPGAGVMTRPDVGQREAGALAGRFVPELVSRCRGG